MFFLKNFYIINNKWVNEKMFKKHNQEGLKHWNTELFKTYVSSGIFDIAFSKKQAESLSGFYKKQKEHNKKVIKTKEIKTGKCYYCFEKINNCLCLS